MKHILILILLCFLNTCVHQTAQVPVSTLVYEMIKETRSGLALRKLECVMKRSAQYGLNPMIITRLGRAESSFRHWLIHSSGAVGIMGVMPQYWDFLPYYLSSGKYNEYLKRHSGTNVISVMKYIDLNIEMGCYILSNYKARYGDYETAIIAYGGYRGKHRHKKEKKEKYLKAVLGK